MHPIKFVERLVAAIEELAAALREHSAALKAQAEVRDVLADIDRGIRLIVGSHGHGTGY